MKIYIYHNLNIIFTLNVEITFCCCNKFCQKGVQGSGEVGELFRQCRKELSFLFREDFPKPGLLKSSPVFPISTMCVREGIWTVSLMS